MPMPDTKLEKRHYGAIHLSLISRVWEIAGRTWHAHAAHAHAHGAHSVHGLVAAALPCSVAAAAGAWAGRCQLRICRLFRLHTRKEWLPEGKHKAGHAPLQRNKGKWKCRQPIKEACRSWLTGNTTVYKGAPGLLLTWHLLHCSRQPKFLLRQSALGHTQSGALPVRMGPPAPPVGYPPPPPAGYPPLPPAFSAAHMSD